MTVRCLLLLLMAALIVIGARPAALSQRLEFFVDQRDPALLAQTFGGADFSRNMQQSKSSEAPDAKELFLQVIDMIDRFYVSSVSIRELLGSAWGRLQFTLLPACMEDMASTGDCQSSAEKCFLDSLDELCRTCALSCNDLLYQATRLLVRGLDPNSALLDRGMLKELQISMSGTFGGVGMVVDSKDNRYVVVSALDGSPAKKAGIKAGDTILEIDGHPLQGLPLGEVLSMVRGPSGSVMTVLLESGPTRKVRQLKMRRQIIRIAPVRGIMLSQNIGYIRIVNFQDDTSNELLRAMAPLSSQSRHRLRGIILDVRDNPGGLFEEAIRTAGLFKPSGKLTSLKGRNPDVTREFFGSRTEPIYDGPIVILANKGSASGSEVLVGALQGMPNVKVIGEKTFGKASVQGVFPLTNALALRLTTAHYYTADGRDIDGRGIDPDVFFDEPSFHAAPRVGPLKVADIETDPVVGVAVAYLLRGELPRRSPFPSLF